MSITFRQYNGLEDFDRIGDFLVENYQSGNQDGNWLQPTWEYMHTHPSLDETSLGKIGIWEDAGKIAAVAHYESQLGEAFFELHTSAVPTIKVGQNLVRFVLDHKEHEDAPTTTTPPLSAW